MEENPLLEQVDPNRIPGVYEAWPGGPRPEGDFKKDADTPAEETLRGMLREQLLLSELTEDVRDAVRDLIDEVDDDGFLNPTPEDLASIDPSRPATLWDEAIIALRSFDPQGIACAGPVEAVREQIARLARSENSPRTPRRRSPTSSANTFRPSRRFFRPRARPVPTPPARSASPRRIGRGALGAPAFGPPSGPPWADAAPTVLPGILRRMP